MTYEPGPVGPTRPGGGSTDVLVVVRGGTGELDAILEWTSRRALDPADDRLARTDCIVGFAGEHLVGRRDLRAVATIGQLRRWLSRQATCARRSDRRVSRRCRADRDQPLVQGSARMS